MKSWPAKALLLAGAGALLAAIPALGQDAPESLLPPGFSDPQNLPPPEPRAQPRAEQPQTQAPAPAAPSLEESMLDLEQVQIDRPMGPRPSNYFAIPPGSARSTDQVGPLLPGNFGLGPNAFGSTSGPLYAALMRRVAAPLPSRWTSILLRRALLSRLNVPTGVQPVDWVAARADLLLRMGEADGARMLVQEVDSQLYTPRMVDTAARTALATADPAAMCPLVAPARVLSRDPSWVLADGMCAALEGEPARASALIDQARGQSGATIDVMLAEKVAGANPDTRRSVTVEWEGVNEIDPWRFGLASASATEIPAALVARAGPRFQAWLARAPMVPLEQRLAAASVAASMGVFSSHSLVEMHSLFLDQTDVAEQSGTVAVRLRAAWIGRSEAERLDAMRGLWREEGVPGGAYARLIMTAGAAARVQPSSDLAADAPDLIASMLSAGLDRQAARWAPVVESGAGGDRAWALLAVATPRPIMSDRLSNFVSADDSPGKLRSQMLAAALAGLGRINASQATDAGFRLGAPDRWTAAIDQAARERSAGAVALLAATGMQTGSWSGVPPQYLFRIIRALRIVGLDYEARMIAAEAVTRL